MTCCWNLTVRNPHILYKAITSSQANSHTLRHIPPKQSNHMSVYAEFILASLSLASATAAHPVSKTSSSVAPSCTDFPGGFDVATGFTLAAYNTTLPNANYTGSPLVLASHGSEEDAQFYSLATWNTYPYNDFSVFNMVDGGISSMEITTGRQAVSQQFSAGEELSFVWAVPTATPYTGFCAIASTSAHGSPTSQFPQLAVGFDTESFYLCGNPQPPSDYFDVVYQPSSTTDCYPIKIHMILSE